MADWQPWQTCAALVQLQQPAASAAVKVTLVVEPEQSKGRDSCTAQVFNSNQVIEAAPSRALQIGYLLHLHSVNFVHQMCGVPLAWTETKNDAKERVRSHEDSLR